MKLSASEVARTERQLQIDVLPDDHPLMPKLNHLFGDHTYFLDGNGLNIVMHATEALDEALEAPASKLNMGQVGVVVNLAYWTDSDPPGLEAHEPELTNSTVALGNDS